MVTSTQWQLSREAAERYEEILVPAILGPAARVLVERVAPSRGDTVVDVGCGTGAAARFAGRHIGKGGRIIGVDVNPGMIEVARDVRVDNDVPMEWRTGNANALPVEDAGADLVLCAQLLQFLDDAATATAIAEMRRILKPGGRVAASTWSSLEDNPYFAALATAIATHISPEAANGLRAAFRLADANTLRKLFVAHGFQDVRSERREMDLSLPPLPAFVPRHISATPMADAYASASVASRFAIVRDVASQFEAGGGSGLRFSQHVLLAVAPA